MVTFTDDFNRTNEVLSVSPDWTAFRGNLRVVSNEVALNTLDGFDASSLCETVLGDDQYAKMTVTARGGPVDTWPGLVVRVQDGSTTDFYFLQVRFDSTANGDTIELFRRISGTYTTIAGPVSISPTAPFTMELRAVGDQITGWIDGERILSATDSTYSSGKTGIFCAAQFQSDPLVNTLRVDNFEAGDVPVPLNIPWLFAWWADQPGWTPPADNTLLNDGVGAPDNLGSGGAFDAFTGNARWITDIASTGKPAIRTVGTVGIRRFVPNNSIPVRTVVVVGRALGADSDLFDTDTSRTLLDTSSGFFRLYAGSVAPTSKAADTDLHLFIAHYNSSGVAGDLNDYLLLDDTQYNVAAGTMAAGGMFFYGYSPNGDGNVDGSEIAFIGFIDRELTTQEKDDLYAWYQAEYLAPPPPSTVQNFHVGPDLVTKAFDGPTEALRVYSDGVLVLGPPAPSGLSALIESHSPQHYWKLDEASGTSFADYGSANDPMLINAGAVDNYQVPISGDITGLDGNLDLRLRNTVWTTVPNPVTFLMFGIGPDGAGTARLWLGNWNTDVLITRTDSGDAQFYVHLGGAQVGPITTGATHDFTQPWMAAVVVSGVNGDVAAYVNGTLGAATSFTGTWQTATNQWYAFKRGDSASDGTTSTLGSLAIIPAALSEAQLNALWQAFSAGTA